MLEKVSIDQVTCRKTAAKLRDVSLRKSFYERPFLKIAAPVEVRLRGYTYAVAVCHQTYNLKHRGLNLFGWDYIEHVFSRLMKERHEVLQPGFLARKSNPEVQSILATLFSEDQEPANTTLDRLEERSAMLIELDAFLEAGFNSSLREWVRKANGCLILRGRGFYESMSGLAAFADPRKKKITFLLKLLEEAGMIQVKDTCNFIPIMDYHMQRVLMRLGCVEINDPELYDHLANRHPQPDDVEIRNTCIKAFRLIALESGHPVTKLNDFFWSLGRSCCNEQPLCNTGHCEKTPCTFFEIVDIKEHTQCFFKEICKGYGDEKYRRLWQPVVETNFY